MPLHRRLAAPVIAGADQFMRARLRRMMMGQPLGPVTTAEREALLADLARYDDPAVLADPDRLLAPLASLKRCHPASGRTRGREKRVTSRTQPRALRLRHA